MRTYIASTIHESEKIPRNNGCQMIYIKHGRMIAALPHYCNNIVYVTVRYIIMYYILELVLIQYIISEETTVVNGSLIVTTVITRCIYCRYAVININICDYYYFFSSTARDTTAVRVDMWMNDTQKTYKAILNCIM